MESSFSSDFKLAQKREMVGRLRDDGRFFNYFAGF
jgi:hypothetical protein